MHPVLSMHSFFSLAAFSGFSHLLSVGLLIYHTVPLHDNQLQQMSLQASSWSRDRRIFRTTVRAEMHFPGKISLYFVSEQHERKWCFLKIKIQRTTLFKELRYLWITLITVVRPIFSNSFDFHYLVCFCNWFLNWSWINFPVLLSYSDIFPPTHQYSFVLVAKLR